MSYFLNISSKATKIQVKQKKWKLQLDLIDNSKSIFLPQTPEGGNFCSRKSNSNLFYLAYLLIT